MGETLVVAGPVGIEAVSLDEGVESFLVYCQAKGGTSGTIYRYRAGLVRLARYLQEHCGVTTLDEVSTDRRLPSCRSAPCSVHPARITASHFCTWRVGRWVRGRFSVGLLLAALWR